jgi:hypothetical protein
MTDKLPRGEEIPDPFVACSLNVFQKYQLYNVDTKKTIIARLRAIKGDVDMMGESFDLQFDVTYDAMYPHATRMLPNIVYNDNYDDNNYEYRQWNDSENKIRIFTLPIDYRVPIASVSRRRKLPIDIERNINSYLGGRRSRKSRNNRRV